jgi:hypothetical protein
MRDRIALGYVAQDLIPVQLADEAQFRPCGNVRQDERKAYLLQHAVRHRVIGLKLADDALEVESLVEIQRRQAKQERAIAPTSQIGAPHVQMYAAGLARHDVLERRMSNGLGVDTPCEYQARKPIDRSAIIASKSERSRLADGTRSIARPMRSASTFETCVK